MNKFTKYISSTLLFIAISAVVPACSMENDQIQNTEEQQVEIVASTAWYKQPKVRYYGALAMGLLAAYAGAVYMGKVASPMQLWKMLSDAMNTTASLSVFERRVQARENWRRLQEGQRILGNRFSKDIDLAEGFNCLNSIVKESIKQEYLDALRKNAEQYGWQVGEIFIGDVIGGKTHIHIEYI